ncbi:MAG: hypothetical protein ABI402_17445 [Ferruginibacter sp.]
MITQKISKFASREIAEKLEQLGLKIMERDGTGLFYVEYKSKTVMVADDKFLDNFLEDITKKEDQELKAYLDELSALSEKEVVITIKSTGEIVELKDFEWVRFKYVKRSKGLVKKLRKSFNKTHQPDFLKDLVNNAEKKAKLTELGFTESMFKRMAAGEAPKGWQVNHRFPLDDSGGNDPGNFILIKYLSDHKALTAYQNSMCKSLNEGQSKILDWAVYDDYVYLIKK